MTVTEEGWTERDVRDLSAPSYILRLIRGIDFELLLHHTNYL